MRRRRIRTKPRDRDAQLDYADAKAVVRSRSCGRCELTIPGVCTTWANDSPHHVQLRSQGGPDTPENMLDTCSPCHDWAHAHPAQANELGIIHLTKG